MDAGILCDRAEPPFAPRVPAATPHVPAATPHVAAATALRILTATKQKSRPQAA